MIAAGKRTEKLLLSELFALALRVVLNQIFDAVMEGISLDEPYQLASAAITAALLVISVLYFAAGKPERGGRAVLAAGFFAMIPAIQAAFSDPNLELTGSCIILIENVKTQELFSIYRYRSSRVSLKGYKTDDLLPMNPEGARLMCPKAYIGLPSLCRLNPVEVIIQEIPKEDWGVAGVPASEKSKN